MDQVHITRRRVYSVNPTLFYTAHTHTHTTLGGVSVVSWYPRCLYTVRLGHRCRGRYRVKLAARGYEKFAINFVTNTCVDVRGYVLETPSMQVTDIDILGDT